MGCCGFGWDESWGLSRCGGWLFRSGGGGTGWLPSFVAGAWGGGVGRRRGAWNELPEFGVVFFFGKTGTGYASTVCTAAWGALN